MKAPKLYLCDPGLMASVVGVGEWTAAVQSEAAGPILETRAHSQLAALAEIAVPPCDLYFYRTRAQVEVDFVLARGGRLVAVEVKSAATVRSHDARGIEAFVRQFPRQCAFGVVLYVGDVVFPISAHAAAVPPQVFFAP